MKRIFVILIISCFGINLSHAQLSDRVNSQSQFKIGTRPVEGNLGVYVGMGIQDFKDIDSRLSASDTAKVMNILPLVSLKYYLSDNLVGRLGIRSKRHNLVMKGKLDPSLNSYGYSEVNYQRMNSEFFINPGIEYHFAKSNILDVYAGGLLAVGILSETHYDFVNGMTNYDSYTRSRLSMGFGFEGFLGIQAFIADLPFSIGIELGSSAIGKYGKKFKVEHKSPLVDETYYTARFEDSDKLDANGKSLSNLKYSELSARTFKLDAMIRLTVNYYFNK